MHRTTPTPRPHLCDDAAWEQLLRLARGELDAAALAHLSGMPDWVELYLPLLHRRADRPYVVAHLAQSLDGCIALPEGESQWISGDDDLEHTHRLRALCDAVVVGALTVEQDDPRLTVRRVPGPSPLRVVIDLHARLGDDDSRNVLDDGVSPTLVISSTPRPALAARGVEVVALSAHDGLVGPADVLAVLAERGVQRVLVEGGGVTVSRFLAAGCVDRLHLVLAPLLVGCGRPTLSVPLGASLASCPRPPTRVVPMGDDWLFDCDLSA